MGVLVAVFVVVFVAVFVGVLVGVLVGVEVAVALLRRRGLRRAGPVAEPLGSRYRVRLASRLSRRPQLQRRRAAGDRPAVPGRPDLRRRGGRRRRQRLI